jgi:hypothetical protein
MSQALRPIAEAVSEYTVEPIRSHLQHFIASFATVALANDELRRLTGVQRFFPSPDSLADLAQALQSPAPDDDAATAREWGDFQTPPELTTRVCSYLIETGVAPQIIIEPTYGTGNFILTALKTFPTVRWVYGIEIQEKYEWRLKLALLLDALQERRSSAAIELYRDDIFTHHFPERMLDVQDVLLLGNPPWVTNSELSGLNSRNTPRKRNIKALRGIDAITGKSNFDIGEFVLIRLLDLFSQQRGTLAMLCKNSAIKSIVEITPQRGFKVSDVRALEINAARDFGAAVEASLLVMELGASRPTSTCRVATLDRPHHTIRQFGWTRNRFVYDLEAYESNAELDGKSPPVWRQGLKHDCARIMELEARDGHWSNGDGAMVDIEERWVFPLLKSSDIKEFETRQWRKEVIVTQRRLGEDTAHLQAHAPKLWQYLTANRECFEKRKSSIYRNKPAFSIFGVGEYSFKKYKVAVSGLYKTPVFSIVPPLDDRPVMLDDTCYFLSFDTYMDALLTASLLNTSIVQRFLQAIVFPDAKRPYTKEILMRIDLARAATELSLDDLRSLWESFGYEPYAPVMEPDYDDFKQRLLKTNVRRESMQYRLGV